MVKEIFSGDGGHHVLTDFHDGILVEGSMECGQGADGAGKFLEGSWTGHDGQ